MPSPAKRKVPVLTYRQRKVARELATRNRQDINAEVDTVLDYVDVEAKRLSKKF